MGISRDNYEYTIVEGDSLITIANKHDMAPAIEWARKIWEDPNNEDMHSDASMGGREVQRQLHVGSGQYERYDHSQWGAGYRGYDSPGQIIVYSGEKIWIPAKDEEPNQEDPDSDDISIDGRQPCFLNITTGSPLQGSGSEKMFLYVICITIPREWDKTELEDHIISPLHQKIQDMELELDQLENTDKAAETTNLQNKENEETNKAAEYASATTDYNQAVADYQAAATWADQKTLWDDKEQKGEDRRQISQDLLQIRKDKFAITQKIAELDEKINRLKPQLQRAMEFSTLITTTYTEQPDDDTYIQMIPLGDAEKSTFIELLYFLDYAGQETREGYELQDGYAHQIDTNVKVYFFPSQGSRDRDELVYYFFATSMEYTDDEMNKIPLSDCINEPVLFFNQNSTSESENQVQEILLPVMHTPTFLNSEDESELTDLNLYVIRGGAFQTGLAEVREAEVTGYYVLKDGKACYPEDTANGKIYYASFEIDKAYYFLATPDTLSQADGDMVHKRDSGEAGSEDPFIIDPASEIKLPIVASPLFMLQDDIPAFMSDTFLYYAHEFETSDGDLNLDNDENDNRPKEVKRCYVRGGRLYYSEKLGSGGFDKASHTRAFLPVITGGNKIPYYFLPSDGELVTLPDVGGDATRLEAEAHNALLWIREEDCIFKELEEKTALEIQLEKRAFLITQLKYYDAEEKTEKKVFFPVDSKIIITLRDENNIDIGTPFEHIIKHPGVAFSFPYTKEAAGYSFELEFNSDTYIHIFKITDPNNSSREVAQSTLMTQTEIDNEISSDDGYLMTHSFLMPPLHIMLKHSVWDVKSTTGYSSLDDIMTEFKSVPAPLAAVLEPEWNLYKFQYYDYTANVFKSVSQYIMLEGTLAHLPVTVRSNICSKDSVEDNNNIIYLPWIELRKERSLLVYGAVIPMEIDSTVFNNLLTELNTQHTNADAGYTAADNEYTDYQALYSTYHKDSLKFERDKWEAYRDECQEKRDALDATFFQDCYKAETEAYEHSPVSKHVLQEPLDPADRDKLLKIFSYLDFLAIGVKFKTGSVVTAIGLPDNWKSLTWEIGNYWRFLFGGSYQLYKFILRDSSYTPATILETPVLPDAPLFEPDKWNDALHRLSPIGAIQRTTNCYAYAMDSRTGHASTPQPGYAAVPGYTDLTSSETLIKEVEDDASTLGITVTKVSGSSYGVLPDQVEGFYLVGLVKTFNSGYVYDYRDHIYYAADYHWYRQDRDGGWSHKPGTTEVVWSDSTGNVITNPETCGRRSFSGAVQLTIDACSIISVINFDTNIVGPTITSINSAEKGRLRGYYSKVRVRELKSTVTVSDMVKIQEIFDDIGYTPVRFFCIPLNDFNNTILPALTSGSAEFILMNNSYHEVDVYELDPAISPMDKIDAQNLLNTTLFTVVDRVMDYNEFSTYFYIAKGGMPGILP